MAISQPDIDAAKDLFADLGAIRTRRMMGGLCLYCDDTLFAMLHSDGRLMIKGADGFGAELEARGGERWTYQRDDGKISSMPYWTLPDDLRDDPDGACALAREALAHL